MQIFVNQHHRPVEDGTRQHPFGTIGQAAAAAMPGDEVIVFPGVYREWVQLPRGGTDDTHRITYRSFLPRGAVLSGAERITGWEALENGIYAAQLPEHLFARIPDTRTEAGIIRPACQLFWNGQALEFSANRDDLMKEKAPFPGGKWLMTPEKDHWTVFVYLSGPDPNGEHMELSVRPACFSAGGNEIHHITLSGFRLEKAASGADQGMLDPRQGQDWMVEDCEFRDGTGCAVLLKNEAPREHPGQDAALGRTIRGCEIHDFKTAGICGTAGETGCRIEGCRIHHIGPDLSDAAPQTYPEACGICLDGEAVILNSQIHHCARGISLNGNVRLTGNVLHQNGLIRTPAPGGDLLVRASGGQMDHNLFLSPSSGSVRGSLAISHNLFAGVLQDQQAGLPFPEWDDTEDMRDNIFAGADRCLIQCGRTLRAPVGPAVLEIIGDEGRWVFRTNLYRLPEMQTETDDLPACPNDLAGLPGPFSDGSSGAWILQPGILS